MLPLVSPEHAAHEVRPRSVEVTPHVGEVGQGLHRHLHERVAPAAGHESVAGEVPHVGEQDGVGVGLLPEEAGVADSEGVQRTQAFHVQVGVHPAELVEHHVADGVLAFRVSGVGVVDGQQGGVAVLDELASAPVCPQPVLPVRVMPGPRPGHAARSTCASPHLFNLYCR